MTKPHQHGLAHDLPALLARRKMLLGLGAGLSLQACFGQKMVTGTSADGSICVSDSIETAGPFPADGTNKSNGEIVNSLTQEGVIRTDVRNSFAGMTPTAKGERLDLELKLVNVNNACAPLAGYAIYIWHCDGEGKYSLYDTQDSNYLRGVGISDANGIVKFTTVFPGCYLGRWPHIHFEIFKNAQEAVSGKAAILTSQFAMPEAKSAEIYATKPNYGASLANLKEVTIATDFEFHDNTAEQMAQQTFKITNETGKQIARSTVGLLI